MAVTKAQLVVWALIAGLGVWGFSALSRVKLSQDAPPPVAAVMTEAPTAAVSPVVVPSSVPVSTAETLPETIPQFPFPDDLTTASVSGSPSVAATSITAFAEVAGDSIPQIATVEGTELVATLGDPAVDAEPAPVVPVASPEMVAATAEEPPIPMPSRPVVAQPAKAVPLEQVKTLYVVADTLNVRAAPSTDGPVLQKVPQGFAVAAREQSNEWIGFLMRDGSTGWMRTDYLSDTMPPTAPTSPVRVWTEPLNLMM